MPKHSAQQNRLFKYKDVAERLICPNCKGIIKDVISAPNVTFLIHANDEFCMLDNYKGKSDGIARLP